VLFRSRAVWDDGADAGKSLRKQTLIGMAPASVTREPATSTRVSSITPPEAGPEASADSAPSVPAPGKSDGPPRPKATMLGLGAVKLPDPGASAPPAQGASSAETAPASVAKADATDSVPRGDEKKLTARHTPIAKQSSGNIAAVTTSAAPEATTGGDSPGSEAASGTQKSLESAPDASAEAKPESAGAAAPSESAPSASKPSESEPSAAEPSASEPSESEPSAA